LGGPGAGPVPVVDVPATPHPLDIRYLPPAVARMGARGVADGFLDHAAAVTAQEVDATGVDALVFLPGVREIERVMRSLEHRLGARAEVLPLHGRLDGAAQDRAVSGGGRRSEERRVGKGGGPRGGA